MRRLSHALASLTAASAGIVFFVSCINPPEGNPVASPNPYLSVLFTTGTGIWLKETNLADGDGNFEDPGSQQSHLIAGDIVASKDIPGPSATLYKGSKWVAWLENETIQAKAIWWGPSRARKVHSSSASTTITAPAIAAFGGRLVVVWGEGDRLFFTTSEHGVRWTVPIPHQGPLPGEAQAAPALAVHQGFLYVGVSDPASGKLYTIQITPEWTWGPNFQAHVSEDPLVAEVSLASDGDKLSLAFATTHAIRVIHSATGYSNWSMAVSIAADANRSYLSGPAIAYWHGRLYAFYNRAAAIQLLMRRSDTFLGLSFTAPEVEVDKASSFRRPAVVASDYSVVPPEPDVVLLRQATEPAGHVNVIYVSESYIESDLGLFRATVEESLAGFTLLSPFRQNLSLLNIYRVDLRSRESGMDRSPDLAAAYSYSPYYTGEMKPLYSDTSLGSQVLGTFTDGSLDRFAEDPTVSPSAYIPCDQLLLDVDRELLNHLLSRVLPDYVEERDLVYVVVKEDLGVQKNAGDPLVNTEKFFRGIGFVHETGHNIGYLGDEDLPIQCAPTERVNGDCRRPNQTINPNLGDPNHKWAHFFVDFDHDGAVDPGDSIVAEVSPNWAGPIVDGRHNYWEPGVSTFASLLNMGLWAAYNTDGWQSAGQPVYGSSEQCLMNHTGAIPKFCAVCAEAIVRGLRTRATDGWSETQHQRYHDEYSRVYLEYEHQEAWEASRPKDGFLEINGFLVPEVDYAGACHGLASAVGPSETCSLDITEYVPQGPATNTIVFRTRQGDGTPFRVQTITVVNGNGAVLPIRPVSSELSQHYSTYYFFNLDWSFPDHGDIVLQVATNRQALP